MQDNNDNSNNNNDDNNNNGEQARLEGLLGKVLSYYANEQDDDDAEAEIENLIAKLQDDEAEVEEKSFANLESIWKKALGHGLKYVGSLFGKQQDDIEDEEEEEAKIEDFLLAKNKQRNKKKSLAEKLLQVLES